MTNILDKIFNELQGEKYQIFGAQKSEEDLLIEELENIKDLHTGKDVPRNSFKQIFYPAQERILEFEGKKIKEIFDSKKRAILGARFFDLKAFALFDEVFKNNINYQKRRKNLFVLGIDSSSKKVESKRDFTDQDLKYIPFDIFLDDDKLLAGSAVGERMLKRLKVKYERVSQLSNTSPRDKKEAEGMYKLFKTVNNHKLWGELGKICIACGKCSMACPTCFCFDFNDEVGPQKSCRDRIWGSCFYQDFTKIAGGYVFKDKIADRIRFWYMHKFLRIPNDYKMVACVGCGRCSEVCPVEISVKKNLQTLKSKIG